MAQPRFEWTPGVWQGWRESDNPYRQFKSERDRAFALQALQLRDGDFVLEVGCGYGWISRVLLEAAKIRWVGLDRSGSMLRQLRTPLESYQPAVLLGDGSRLPFPSGSFDKVLSTGVLMHVEDEFAVLREMHRVLRPGGILLCSMNSIYSPISWGGWLRNRHKKGYIQKYLRPVIYRRFLQDLGLQIVHVTGDGLLSTGALRLGRFSLPPAWAFPIIRTLDSWAVARFPELAHEVWFTAVKPSEPRTS